MSDLTFDVPEERLEKLVFLLNDELVVKHSLHRFLIANLGKHGKPLQLQ